MILECITLIVPGSRIPRDQYPDLGSNPFDNPLCLETLSPENTVMFLFSNINNCLFESSKRAPLKKKIIKRLLANSVAHSFSLTMGNPLERGGNRTITPLILG
jgi:hypothetical protein